MGASVEISLGSAQMTWAACVTLLSKATQLAATISARSITAVFAAEAAFFSASDASSGASAPKVLASRCGRPSR